MSGHVEVPAKNSCVTEPPFSTRADHRLAMEYAFLCAGPRGELKPNGTDTAESGATVGNES